MANNRHLEILGKGYLYWRTWRENNLNIIPDLSGIKLSGINLSAFNLSFSNLTETDFSDTNLSFADLSKAILKRARISGADLSNSNLSEIDLTEADLSYTNLTSANLKKAKLIRATLTGAILNNANLTNANLTGANLSRANLNSAICHKCNFSKACLTEANLFSADLSKSNLSKSFLSEANLCGALLVSTNLSKATIDEADLNNANLTGARLIKASLYNANLLKANFTQANLTGSILIAANCVETDFTNATIENAYIYGISIWNIKNNGLIQRNLIVTKDNEPAITVDNIEVAQFIYLLLNNKKIREVIGTIAKKGVLILGRFTPERKKVLEAIRDKLREFDFVPIMFDFEKAKERDFTETIKILAGLSRFVIADITNPKSAPLELQATIPDYKIPFLTIIQKGETPFSMFSDLQQKYNWVLPTMSYSSETALIKGFKKGILDVALKVDERLQSEKQSRTPKILDIEDFED